MSNTKYAISVPRLASPQHKENQEESHLWGMTNLLGVRDKLTTLFEVMISQRQAQNKP